MTPSTGGRVSQRRLRRGALADQAAPVRSFGRVHLCLFGEAVLRLGGLGSGHCTRQVAGGHRIQSRRHHYHGQPEFPGRDGLPARRDRRQAPQHVRDAGGAGQRGLSRVLGAARPRRISISRIQAARQGRPRDLDPGVLQSDHRRGRQAGEGRQVRDRHHRAQDPQPRRCRQDFRDRPRPGGDRV